MQDTAAETLELYRAVMHWKKVYISIEVTGNFRNLRPDDISYLIEEDSNVAEDGSYLVCDITEHFILMWTPRSDFRHWGIASYKLSSIWHFSRCQEDILNSELLPTTNLITGRSTTASNFQLLDFGLQCMRKLFTEISLNASLKNTNNMSKQLKKNWRFFEYWWCLVM